MSPLSTWRARLRPGRIKVEGPAPSGPGTDDTEVVPPPYFTDDTEVVPPPYSTDDTDAVPPHFPTDDTEVVLQSN